MKHTYIRYTSYLILLISIAACSKKNTDISPAALEGYTWQQSRVISIDNGKETDITASTFDDCDKSTQFVFSNGKLTISNTAACYKSAGASGPDKSTSYVLKGDQLTLTETGGYSFTVTVSFSGNTMTWYAPDATNSKKANKLIYTHQ